MTDVAEQVSKHPIAALLGAFGLSSTTMVGAVVFWLDNTYALAEDLQRHSDEVILFMQIDDVRDELKDIRYRKRQLTIRIEDAAAKESMYMNVWKSEKESLIDDEKELTEELLILNKK